MAKPFDKEDQIIRELKVVMKEILNSGHLISISDAYNDPYYMEQAEKAGLIAPDGSLLDFYTQELPADELEHVISKGKGGKFVIGNCIPVASQHNPRRGYNDEPLIKLRRVCKDLVRTDLDSDDVIARYKWWASLSDSHQINLEEYELMFLEAQAELATHVDRIILNFCNNLNITDPTPNATEKYAKKLRDRKIK